MSVTENGGLERAENSRLGELPPEPPSPVLIAVSRDRGKPQSELSAMFASAGRRAGELSDSLRHRVRTNAGLMQARLRSMKDERPLHLLAIICGVAFVSGITLAVWRSRRS